MSEICFESFNMQYKWSITDEWAKITSYQRNWCGIFIEPRQRRNKNTTSISEVAIEPQAKSLLHEINETSRNALRVETSKWNIESRRLEIFHWDVSTRKGISRSRDKFHLIRSYFCEFGGNTTFVLLVSTEKQNGAILTKR